MGSRKRLIVSQTSEAGGHERGVQHLTVTGVRKWAPARLGRGYLLYGPTYDVRYRIPAPHAGAARPVTMASSRLPRRQIPPFSRASRAVSAQPVATQWPHVAPIGALLAISRGDCEKVTDEAGKKNMSRRRGRRSGAPGPECGRRPGRPERVYIHPLSPSADHALACYSEEANILRKKPPGRGLLDRHRGALGTIPRRA